MSGASERTGQAAPDGYAPTGRSRATTQEIAEAAHVPTAEELMRVVALDGPAGTGKSSVARGVASALGWRFVDTGATYRAATLAVQRAELPLQDGDRMTGIVADAAVELGTDPSAPWVRLDGVDVSEEIRGAAVTAAVSAVSAVPGVRRLLIAVQRHAAGTAGAVVEGRDIATVVAPLAGVKVYLDARPEVRAQRRARELESASAVGESEIATETKVEASLAIRDALDNQTNELRVSEGAVHLDTSDLSLEQVIHAIVDLVLANGEAGSR